MARLIIGKCDQKRPECGNCKKSNRECAGYHRAVVFRNATGPRLDTHATKASVSADPLASSSGNGGSSAAKDAMPVTMYRRPAVEIDFPLLITPSPQPHLQSALLGNFLEGYTPPNSQLIGVPSVWVHSVLFAMNRDVQVFDTSIMAMCAVFVARGSKDERLLQESAMVYTIALAQLNAALSNPVARVRDETLAATMALSMYEVGHSIHTDLDIE